MLQEAARALGQVHGAVSLVDEHAWAERLLECPRWGAASPEAIEAGAWARDSRIGRGEKASFGTTALTFLISSAW